MLNRILACVLVTHFLLTGCGGGSHSTAPPPETPTLEPAPTSTTTRLECNEGLTHEPIHCEADFVLDDVTFHDRYVTAGSIEWHVVEAGKPDAPPIFFIHGVPESWYDWHLQMIDQAQDYHVIALDLKGFGRSAHPHSDDPTGSGAYNASHVATEILALMDAIGLNDRVTLVSHDWGTLVANYLVNQAGARFSGWARMSAPVNGDGDEIVALNTQFTLFQNFDFCKAVFSGTSFIFNLYGYNGVPGSNGTQPVANALVDRVNEEWRFDALTPATACKYYSDTPEIINPTFWETTLPTMMASVDMPVYLIQAENDLKQPLYTYEHAVDAFPAGMATLYPISDTGHFMMFEQPEKVTQAIRELIAKEAATSN